MTLKLVFNERKKLPENAMYRWLSTSYTHYLFKKLNSHLDEIYCNYQFMGNVEYDFAQEKAHFKFCTRLNDYNFSAGSIERVITFNQECRYIS